MNEGRTRRYLSDALKKFRTATDTYDRLRNLWKIGQLIGYATDEELYDLALIAAAEEDHRLRGEICYIISRSQRPQLRLQFINILRDMAMDEDPYVRRSAVIALGELGEIGDAVLIAIEPILNAVNELRSTIVSLQEELVHLRDSVGKLTNVAAPSLKHGIIVDDYVRSWETYLRHERELLQDHKGEYVAIYGEEIVGVDEDEEKLARIVYEKYGSVEALICRIEGEGGPIRIPPPRSIVGS